MSKRPSLAETMRQVVQTSPEQPAPSSETAASRADRETTAAGRFHAATREGKKKVTGNLPPSTHKLLKTLAVQHDTALEDLVLEAIGDLLAKYNVKDKAA